MKVKKGAAAIYVVGGLCVQVAMRRKGNQSKVKIEKRKNDFRAGNSIVSPHIVICWAEIPDTSSYYNERNLNRLCVCLIGI